MNSTQPPTLRDALAEALDLPGWDDAFPLDNSKRFSDFRRAVQKISDDLAAADATDQGPDSAPFGYVVRQPDGHETYFKGDPTGFRANGWSALGVVVHTLFDGPVAARPAPTESRERFEQACYAHYMARHAAGKTEDHQVPAGPREALLWRQESGVYGVLMFNASWWAWQEALK